MTTRDDLEIIQLTDPGGADPAIREELTECWIAVTNAGGAAGFPFPPVNAGHVGPAVDALAAHLDPERTRILLAPRQQRPRGMGRPLARRAPPSPRRHHDDPHAAVTVQSWSQGSSA